MDIAREHMGNAAGAGVLRLVRFVGSLIQLNGEGPVLGRSEGRAPLSGIPSSISLNPLRDRSSEREAAQFIRSMRDGNCREELADWFRNYRRKYAAFISASETPPPRISWSVGDWEDTPRWRYLHYTA
mgnify:CR=1 FL=1